MQAILSDITLDVRQLNILVHSLEEKPNEELKEVILRTISRVQLNLDELSRNVAESECAPASSGESETIHEVKEENPVQEKVKEVLEQEQRVETEPDAPMMEEKSDRVETKTLGDKVCRSISLKSMLSLNDIFRFSRELFGGEQPELYAALEKISQTASLQEAETLLREMVVPNADEDVLAELFERVERYFNNI